MLLLKPGMQPRVHVIGILDWIPGVSLQVCVYMCEKQIPLPVRDVTASEVCLDL